MRLIGQLLCKISNKNKYFVTTPIFYVNGDPHIGHLHTLLQADVLCRHRALKGSKDAIFSAGTDEHGLKIQRAAELCKLQPIELCNQNSQKFKRLCTDFGIKYTHFIRTCDDKHRKSVQHFWKTLVNNGHIYKANYEGWYSVSDETFVSSTEISEKEIDGKMVKVSTSSGHQLEWLKEENYMFRITSFHDQLRTWINSSPDIIKPSFLHLYLNQLLDKGLSDLSISRPRSRLKWGIEVPDDDSQTIYVWLDALVNYLTVSNYPDKLISWPPDCQIIGKDIFNFHAVFWPAFLIAANLQLPKRIICHSHWQVDGQKMSKSLGNVFSPFDLLNSYSVDAIRYFFMREAFPNHDSDFSSHRIKLVLNSDLADILGNLLLRAVSPAINSQNIYPKASFDLLCHLPLVKEIFDVLTNITEKVDTLFDEGEFGRAISLILTPIKLTNKLFEELKPWKMVKIDPKSDDLMALIHIALDSIRIAAILLQPIVPDYANQLLTKLKVPQEMRKWENAQVSTKITRPSDINLSEEKLILFQKIK